MPPVARRIATSAAATGTLVALSLVLPAAAPGAGPAVGEAPESRAHVAAPYVADVSEDRAVFQWFDGDPAPAAVGDVVTSSGMAGVWRHAAQVRVEQGVASLVIDRGPFAGRRVRVHAPPPPGAPLVFVAWGDNRSGHADHAIVTAAVRRVAPDLVVSTGDLVVTSLLQHWREFFRIEADLLATTPMFPAFGNHEAIDEAGLFDTFFPCPTPRRDGTRSCVRDYGALRVVVIDTESPPAEVEWVRHALTEPRPATGAGAVEIVTMHRPLFSFSRHAPDLAWREALHPILVAADVEVVFQGHNHTYERFDVDGVAYVTTGGGGAPRYSADSGRRDAGGGRRITAASVLHFVVGRVAGGRIELEAVEATTGGVIDRFVTD